MFIRETERPGAELEAGDDSAEELNLHLGKSHSDPLVSRISEIFPVWGCFGVVFFVDFDKFSSDYRGTAENMWFSFSLDLYI